MPSHRQSVRALVISVLAIATAPIAGHAVAADQPAGNSTTAGGNAKASPRFDVRSGSCQQFLDLGSDVRGLVVAWTAGRYSRSSTWIVDENVAPKAVANVEKACADAPDASFWYKVMTEFKLEAKAASKKKKKK